MSTQEINRVEAEVQEWREREERFLKNFHFDMSTNKALLRKQSRDYDRIIVKYRNTKDPEERLTLLALKQERKHIEKQAYPNRFVRAFRQLFIDPIERHLFEQDNKRLEQANQQNILRQLRQLSMSEHYPEVEKRMKNGEREFSVPVSYQINEYERMDHDLVFKRNNFGEYNLISNKVRLQNETNSAMSRQQTFELSDGTTVNAKEIYNLLKGRAVQKDGKWIKFDLNDRDTKGNYRVKEFPKSYGFSVEGSLKELPIEEMKNKTSKDKILDDLKKGERTKVSIGGKKYYAETDPQFKTVNLFDENSQKISKSELLGKKSAQEKRINQDFKNRVTRTVGVRI